MVEYDSGTSKNRAILCFNRSEKSGIDIPKYARFGEIETSANQGVVMVRPGSIVGITMNVAIDPYSSPGNFRVTSKINDDNKLFTSTGIDGDPFYSEQSSAPAGVHHFGNGDLIQVYIDPVSGVYSWKNCIIMVEVEYTD